MSDLGFAGGFGLTRRASGPPVSPGFSSDGSVASRDTTKTRANGSGGGSGGTDTATDEYPMFVTVAQFCTLGVAEESAAPFPSSLTTSVPGGEEAGEMSGGEGRAAAIAAGVAAENPTPAIGGGGAVTSALLPSLFPQGAAAGCALSEGVRMMVTSAEQEGGAMGTTTTASGGVASPGMFSLHSVATRDVIVKASLRLSLSTLLLRKSMHRRVCVVSSLSR